VLDYFTDQKHYLSTIIKGKGIKMCLCVEMVDGQFSQTVCLSDDSSDSSDSSDEDSEAEQERPAGEERLVRCKRPMCAMYCENGFKEGEDGCPICECVEDSEDSDRPLIGRPDGHEVGTNPACAGRPMCLMYCELGFKRDDDGCPICDCLEDPCQVIITRLHFTVFC